MSLKIGVAVALLVVVVGVGRCVFVGRSEVLVSGAVVTVGAVPTAPAGILVISRPTDFGGPQASGLNALRGLVFFVPSSMSSLVDTRGMTPVAALYATRLDIASRDWKSGFPGVPGERNEWFQIEYEGELATAQEGAHQFELLSDDGSKLFIDEQMVIVNDGRHPPKSALGIAVLPRGRHRIRVSYFQGPRYEIALQLYVTPPSGVRQILDISRVL